MGNKCQATTVARRLSSKSSTQKQKHLNTTPENNESQKPPFWERVPRWLRNKYLITALGFIAWMLFIDRNDLPTQWKRVKELRTLQQSEKTMDKQITNTKQELELLKTDRKSVV